MKEINPKLKDKIVVVTGGSGGLGEQIAYEAAKQGAIVVVCARRIFQIGKVKEKCEELSGRQAHAFQLDVANYQDIDEVVDKIYQQVGNIDVLVNCAGFGLFKDFVDTKFETAKQMFQVNVLGLMYLTQKVAIEMVKVESGHIINVASQAGKMATPKSSVYSATKFAVIGFSNALRLELKPVNVSVTTVNPGPVATDFFAEADPTGQYLGSLGNLVIEPTELAKKIVKAMGTRKREINEPCVMITASKFYTLFPHIGDYLASTIFNKK